MFSNGTHKQRWHAVADLPDTFVEFPRELKRVGKGTEPLEFRKRKPAAFGPMHRPVHTEVAVIAPNRSRRLLRIELHGIEALACDRFLR